MSFIIIFGTLSFPVNLFCEQVAKVLVARGRIVDASCDYTVENSDRGMPENDPPTVALCWGLWAPWISESRYPKQSVSRFWRFAGSRLCPTNTETQADLRGPRGPQICPPPLSKFTERPSSPSRMQKKPFWRTPLGELIAFL